MDYALSNVSATKRTIGKGVVFYAPKWDPATGGLELTHLGDTEGDITFTPNAEVSTMTAPELSGPAPIAADYTGEAPTLELPIFLADPSLLGVISPGGAAGAGNSVRRAATEYTLVVFPESLLIGVDGNGQPQRQTLAFAGGVWTLGGTPLTAAQEALLADSLFAWRCVFSKPPRRWLGGAGDAKKNIETATATLMIHDSMPEGQKLYTYGDPAEVDIDLEGMS